MFYFQSSHIQHLLPIPKLQRTDLPAISYFITAMKCSTAASLPEKKICWEHFRCDFSFCGKELQAGYIQYVIHVTYTSTLPWTAVLAHSASVSNHFRNTCFNHCPHSNSRAGSSAYQKPKSGCQTQISDQRFAYHNPVCYHQGIHCQIKDKPVKDTPNANRSSYNCLYLYFLHSTSYTCHMGTISGLQDVLYDVFTLVELWWRILCQCNRVQKQHGVIQVRKWSNWQQCKGRGLRPWTDIQNHTEMIISLSFSLELSLIQSPRINKW